MTPAKTTKTKTVKVKKAPKPLPELAPNPFAFEVFDLASKQRAKAKKIEVLQKYDDPSIRTLFIWNYDDSVVTVLPPGDVPYSSLKDEQNTTGTLTTNINQQASNMAFNNTMSMGNASDLTRDRTTIRKEYTKFFNFIKGGNNSLNGLRRETMFIQILEGLHPLEAEILCLVKDKKLESKYKIPLDIVKEAYSTIRWGGRGG
tara:strand:+ start:424 stop:1029 length:606 start_codon:yes stop_codon:yes gene_type:complete